MKKTLNILLCATLIVLGIFVLLLVVYSLLFYVTRTPVRSKPYEIVPACFHAIGVLLSLPTIFLMLKSDLALRNRICYSLGLINIILTSLAIHLLMLKQGSYDNRIFTPLVITFWVLLIVMTLICFLLPSHIPPRRPTKAERLEARIAEPEQEVKDLKKGD